jgi:hypothetical protein
MPHYINGGQIKALEKRRPFPVYKKESYANGDLHILG